MSLGGRDQSESEFRGGLGGFRALDLQVGLSDFFVGIFRLLQLLLVGLFARQLHRNEGRIQVFPDGNASTEFPLHAFTKLG